LPVMGYVVGGALSTGLVAKTQQRFGRKGSFQLGLLVALLSAGLGAWAVMMQSFWLVVTATVVAGYYSANAQLYRFAAAELCAPEFREKAVSLVMAGGLIGAVIGPNLAMVTKNMLPMPFAGAYVALAVIAVVSMCLMAFIQFPPAPVAQASDGPGRPLRDIMLQPVFMVAALAAALGYGVNRMGARVACDWHVCAGLLHRAFDQTVWCAARHGSGRVAQLGLYCCGLAGH
jgi:MFS family permease